MHNIIIHYPFVASYRVAVFNELANNNKINLTVLSAEKSKDDTLLSEKVGWKFDHITTRLYSFQVFKKIIDFETGVLSKLIKLRKKNTVYVILSNPNILSSWCYSLFARCLGYQVIFWGHGLLKKEYGLRRVLRKLYYSLANKHWVYGDNAIPLMNDLGINENVIYPIYNSLNYKTQKKLANLNISKRDVIRNDLGYLKSDLVAICMGRLLPKLKIDQVINNIKYAEKNNIKLKLIVIGDGPEKDRLIGIAENENLTKYIVFTGAIYDEKDLSVYYNAADLSIVMGVVGLSAMHSLAYGVPLLTNNDLQSHCPEIEAIRPGESGEFFENNNLDSFITGLALINKNKDNYKKRCIEIIEEKYTPEMQVQFILESLND
jgi:glycosyltransferase involved in cell wall biosynthesis